MTFCNPHSGKLAVMAFCVPFLIKPALLHGALSDEHWRLWGGPSQLVSSSIIVTEPSGSGNTSSNSCASGALTDVGY